jgi:cell division protein FtsQ
VKLVLKILMILFLATYLIVVLAFAGKQYEGVLCKGMEIVVRDSLERALITSVDVKNLVRLDHPEPAGMPVSAIDMSGIEETLNDFPAISNAQVYTNVKGGLIVELSQRNPVVRIEDRNHQHYYLDAEGYVIPANLDYAPHVLYINGEIPGNYRKEKRIMVTGASPGENGHTLMGDVLKMGRYIHEHPFWRSQIVQIYVGKNGEFELIPRVGSQIIYFGSAERMENKFFKLKTLYQEGFTHTGWNQYEKINLKYTNQVICTKR